MQIVKREKILMEEKKQNEKLFDAQTDLRWKQHQQQKHRFCAVKNESKAKLRKILKV